LALFYKNLAERIDDPEVIGVLTKLAKIEQKHKQRLFDLYLTLEPAITEKDAFESDIVSEVMEGGFTTEEFMEQNKDSLKTVTDVLNIAMMLESQAMDLYMRYSEKAKDEKSKTVLYDIAEEEKAHLKTLGRLMDERA
jgi:rubrerythrin